MNGVETFIGIRKRISGARLMMKTTYPVENFVTDALKECILGWLLIINDLKPYLAIKEVGTDVTTIIPTVYRKEMSELVLSDKDECTDIYFSLSKKIFL